MSNGFASQLVFCNVPARDTSGLLKFYSTLLGVDTSAFVHNTVSPIDQYETPITSSGIDLLITARNEDREVTTTYWAVSDIGTSIQTLEGHGGVVVSGPDKMPDGGMTAALLDPEGNYVGLVQLPGDAEKYFRFRKREGGDEHLARRRKQLRAAVAG